ncbi:sugar transferase [Prochlorococcus sp. AH-716-N03]|nr:sugar transferase [Prochlorococcus sp. AH-716-N03]
MKIKKERYYKKNTYKIIKTFFDIFFALIFLIVGFPIFFIIALLIKLSSRGPIFFSQERIGKNKKTFNCIKFRTMHPEADDILENLMINNEVLRKEFEETHKLKNDPRITNIGKFLRKTSLDEIPQFLNVIKMEMSIVGPRPIVKKEILKYGKSYKRVISLKPGITGLWQVSGRNNLSYKRRVILDCLYVDNMNPIIDLRIIIRTLGVILFPNDRGAY